MSEKFKDWIDDNGEKRYLIITDDNKVFLNNIRCYTLQEAHKEIENE